MSAREMKAYQALLVITAAFLFVICFVLILVFWDSVNKQTWFKWLFGLVFVSTICGYLVVVGFRELFMVAIPNLPRQSGAIPSWLSGDLIGFLERLFFCVAVALNLGGCIVAMVAWATIKNTMFWKFFSATERVDRRLAEQGDQPDSDHRNDDNQDVLRGFVALAKGFVSMLMALIGGVIIRLWCGYA